MSLIGYYIQDTENGEWRRQYCFYHPESDRFQIYSTPTHVPIRNYMGHNWSSATDIFKTLIKQSTYRRQIIQEAAILLRTEDQDTIHVTHPLLQPPLCLGRTDSDREFRMRIEVRQTLYRIQVIIEHL